MILEALVFYSCLNGKGCAESSVTYYQQSEEARTLVKEAEEKAKRLVDNNEYIVYVATPAYALIAGKPAEFVVNKNWTISVELKEPAVGVKWSY